MIFTFASIALQRALLQSIAPVSNFDVVYHGCFLACGMMYQSVFQSEDKLLCSKVMLGDMLQSDPFFPTLTCGVFVFNAASAAPPAFRPPSVSHHSPSHPFITHTSSHYSTHFTHHYLHITHFLTHSHPQLTSLIITYSPHTHTILPHLHILTTYAALEALQGA